MKIASLKLVCFSPTGTTKSIVQGIARGINQPNVELIDITTPEGRQHKLQASENELLVVGVPVYMGRVPALLKNWLHSIEAHDTPTVCVVVYGNRAYDNALRELTDILTDRGCVPIGAAAYIGEHSFHSAKTPAASVGRPDESDLNHAARFGLQVNEKLRAIGSVDPDVELNVPGRYPYEGVSDLWHIDFISVSAACTHCGICRDGCPAGAVDSEKCDSIDKDKCTLCCACIKHCPNQARSVKPGLMMEASMRVSKLFLERREPEFFL